MASVGIDFGTTNSVLAEYGTDGPRVLQTDSPPGEWAALGFDRILPSVVAVDDSGTFQVGWKAKIAPTARRFSAVKRLFLQEESIEAGGQEFLVEEIATALFSHLKRQAQDSGCSVASAVITVPANSRGLARHRTKVCAGMAEIEPLALINEPTAAAMAFGIDAQFDQTICVVDLGGGTLDVTILETVDGAFVEQSSRGVTRLGGIDFDSAVLRRIAEEAPESQRWTTRQKQDLLLEIEKAKIRLSSQEETQIVSEAIPQGYRLTRPTFDAASEHLLARIERPIRNCLSDLDMAPGDLDHLVLVGGMSNVPAVRNLVANALDASPAVGADPLTAVAEGAAIAAAVLTGQIGDKDIFVCTEHALGTVVLDPTSEELRFSQIIPRNQKLPAKRSDSYSPVRDYQKSVDIRVIEGDPDQPVEAEDNVTLASMEIPFDPPRPAAEAGFTLTYSYDRDGILSVEVKDEMTEEHLSEPLAIAFKGARTPEELVGIAKSAKQMVGGEAVPDDEGTEPKQKSHDPESNTMLQNARVKVIPFLEDAEAAELKQLADTLEGAGDDQREEAKQALREALRKYTYLL